jgi:hypothetical protein
MDIHLALIACGWTAVDQSVLWCKNMLNSFMITVPCHIFTIAKPNPACTATSIAAHQHQTGNKGPNSLERVDTASPNCAMTACASST